MEKGIGRRRTFRSTSQCTSRLVILSLFVNASAVFCRLLTSQVDSTQISKGVVAGAGEERLLLF